MCYTLYITLILHRCYCDVSYIPLSSAYLHIFLKLSASYSSKFFNHLCMQQSNFYIRNVTRQKISSSSCQNDPAAELRFMPSYTLRYSQNSRLMYNFPLSNAAYSSIPEPVCAWKWNFDLNSEDGSLRVNIDFDSKRIFYRKLNVDPNSKEGDSKTKFRTAIQRRTLEKRFLISIKKKYP